MFLIRVLACSLALFLTAPKAEVSGAVGADWWNVDGSPARYLPDYSLPRPFKSPSMWGRIKASTQIETPVGHLGLAAVASHSELTGSRIDRLDADLRVTDNLGARLGVLPYRVSWCRQVGEGPWMLEPDAYCRFHGLKEVAEGAFGAQLYATGVAGNWLLDGMMGTYRPKVDGQDEKLGPYVAVGPTVRHTKMGASLNGMHLPTGVQLRGGWLYTEQDQDDVSGSKGAYQRLMRYTMTYMAAEAPIGPVSVRASLNTNAGQQVNRANLYLWDGTSKTLELIYAFSGQSLALGHSVYENRTTYPKPPNGQRVKVPSLSLAYRRDLADGWTVAAQATRTDDYSTTRRGVTTERNGFAYGVRLARSF